MVDCDCGLLELVFITNSPVIPIRFPMAFQLKLASLILLHSANRPNPLGQLTKIGRKKKVQLQIKLQTNTKP